MVKLLFLFVTIFLLSSVLSRKKEPLRFGKNRQFTILHITDLHYGETEGKDTNTSRLTDFLVNITRPDFVAITGDAVSGFAWDGKVNSFSYNMWRNWTSVFTKYKTKYAYTFGNHDSEADLSREAIYEFEVTNPYSYTYRSYDINGVSNYVLPIYSSFSDNSNDLKSDISALLWFFDSNREGCRKMANTWGCIEDDQIEWYSEQSRKIEKLYGRKDGLAFFHIPIPEYVDVYNWRSTYGKRTEGICCPKINTKLFSEIQKWRNIQGTFAGHDHNNDYGGVYKGVELVYGRKTGYGSYGPDFFQRGARLITLTEYKDEEGNIRMKFEHKVIQEDGTWDHQRSVWHGLFDYQSGCSY